MGVRCFMVTDSGKYRLSLRRYHSKDTCPVRPGAYHNAESPTILVIDGAPFRTPENYTDLAAMEVYAPPRTDPRWPTKCAECSYKFTADDPWQLFSTSIYVDDHGAEYSIRKPVPGMMWDAWWFGDWARGPDGKCLVVCCPDGTEWMIDGQAKNCTKKADVGPFGQAHRCWIRHGTPPMITVDKNGLTCSAGAGSIAVPGYHGFLRNGQFT